VRRIAAGNLIWGLKAEISIDNGMINASYLLSFAFVAELNIIRMFSALCRSDRYKLGACVNGDAGLGRELLQVARR
jgi:hypothetical protein